jgi:transposase
MALISEGIPPSDDFLKGGLSTERGLIICSEKRKLKFLKLKKLKIEVLKMKTAEKKEKFIFLRAEGLSYSKITKEIHISKATCSRWEKELKNEIKKAKEERLEGLFSLYRIGREAHIEKLGEMVKRIDEAIAQKDLDEIPAEKLLRLKLEYEDRLQSYYTEPTEEGAESFNSYSQEEMLEAVGELYERIKKGTVTATQAKTELAALEAVQKAITTKENIFW